MSLQKKLELIRERDRVKASLPHLYGFDLYPFQDEFLETSKEWQFLVACNQVGKTTTLILKLIKLATDQKLWKKYWQDRPRDFIYLLPNQKLHNINAESKWLDLLPKDEFTDDDYYGWEWEKRGKDYLAVKFRNGVTIRFLSYGQSVFSMQNISAHVICFDEEPPWEIVPEVQTRTSSIKIAAENAVNAFAGFKIFGFTATKSQEYFRTIMEEKGEFERFPVTDGNVWKKSVSMFECTHHVSGKPSTWTPAKIQKIIDSLPTEAEVNRRVYGKFQASEGLVYPQFVPGTNSIESLPPLPGYSLYAGIDYGAGGTSHPSAIVFVAVSPDYKRGYVTDAWIGDDGGLTTCDDVVEKYIAMCRGREVVSAYYDWAAKDLHTFATRKGVTLLKANKDHKIGEDLLNSLFKSRSLFICNIDYSANKLCNQLNSLVHKARKRDNDDLIDALRYAVTTIPWDHNTDANESQVRDIMTAARSMQTIPRYRDGTPRNARHREDSDFDYDYETWRETFNL